MCVQLVHAVPGRIRFRLNGDRDSEDVDGLRQRLAGNRTVSDVVFRRTTRSIVVYYDPGRTVEFVRTLESSCPEISSENLQQISRSEGAVATGATVSLAEVLGLHSPRTAGENQPEGRNLLPGALATLSALLMLREVFRKQELSIPRWYDLAWWALSSHLSLVRETGETSSASQASSSGSPLHGSMAAADYRAADGQ